MLKFILPLLVGAVSATAAEYRFDFGQFSLGQCPTGFVSVVSGFGKPGEWKIVEEQVSSLIAPFSSNAPQTAKRPILAQTSQDRTGEHFPILLFDNEIYADFTLTTRFRIISGSVAQMAGVTFRAADEKNYYVVCASALDNYVRFYKSIANIRSTPIGRQTKVAAGVWHELKVTCKGSEIRCELDGLECLPPLNDTSLASGKIGFWTKSDSVSQFVDARVEYTPVIPFAKKLLDQTVKKYPRLLGLELYARKGSGAASLVASSKTLEMGAAAGKIETDAIERAAVYFQHKDKSVEVTLPLRDRNGEVAAALKVEMRTFMGETEGNAVNRAGLIRKYMESELGAATNLAE